ncbi:MAG: MBL fold metallo-hydrolase [Prevotella sp.]|nr:MBL fold metallo-hydrolase [Prevotella sp.]
MKRKMIYTALVILAVLIGWQGYEFWVAVGRQPRGERLERCKQSPQWKDGEFVNVHETPTLTGDDGFFSQMWKFLFGRVDDLKPGRDIPVVKNSLKDIPRTEEVCVWLGHSSVYIQTGGLRFLFDPVLTNKLPVWWFMRPFKGADAYTTDDIPEVDYLIITHDHWDHLDWKTVAALRDRVGQVVCSLGIGEHFEYWGYDPKKIHDLDWGDSIAIDNGQLTIDNLAAQEKPSDNNCQFTLRCLPTRHFSGRMGQHKTLWASYLIDGPRCIFVSGDGGYDERFKQIGEQYPDIDLAIMENGQYDEGWHYIHTLPRELPQAISDLGAHRVLTYHNSKYALANHSWTEPLDSIYEHAKGQPWQLLTPRIGEPIRLNEQQTFEKWW